jgi:hypothetical protein
MRSSSNAVGILAPTLLLGTEEQGWSKQRDQINPAYAGSSKSGPRWQGRQVVDEKGTKMKFLANATAFVVALSLMIGLLVAQHNYQRSWREPVTTQSPSNTVAQPGNIQAASDYKVVLK